MRESASRKAFGDVATSPDELAAQFADGGQRAGDLVSRQALGADVGGEVAAEDGADVALQVAVAGEFTGEVEQEVPRGGRAVLGGVGGDRGRLPHRARRRGDRSS
jgi:hypothetical protein